MLVITLLSYACSAPVPVQVPIHPFSFMAIDQSQQDGEEVINVKCPCGNDEVFAMPGDLFYKRITLF